MDSERSSVYKAQQRRPMVQANIAITSLMAMRECRSSTLMKTSRSPMSKAALHAFIDRAREDQTFRDQLADLGPQQIIDYAARNGFMFSDEIKGRFINRWAGVYFCPQAIEVGTLCPKLVPPGYKNLIHYAQSTCSSSELKEEERDFRSGQKY